MPTEPEPPTPEAIEAVDLTIAAETQRILAEWIGFDPALSPPHRQTVVDREAVRLHELTEQAAEAYQAQGYQEWARRTTSDREPDPATAAAIRETAWRAARETVLAAELYSRVSQQAAREHAEIEARLATQARRRHETARRAADPHRWTRIGDVTPLPVAERIVERIWLERPGPFRALAQALITQRIEDGVPVPATAADPLVLDLEAMIDDELATNPPPDPTVPF